MTLELPGWRFWLGFGGIGSALAFGYRGDWWAAAAAGACVVLGVVASVCGELPAARAELGIGGRHRGHGLRNVAAALRAAAKIPLP